MTTGNCTPNEELCSRPYIPGTVLLNIDKTLVTFILKGTNHFIVYEQNIKAEFKIISSDTTFDIAVTFLNFCDNYAFVFMYSIYVYIKI